jgi:hypothetical protein
MGHTCGAGLRRCGRVGEGSARVRGVCVQPSSGGGSSWVRFLPAGGCLLAGVKVSSGGGPLCAVHPSVVCSSRVRGVFDPSREESPHCEEGPSSGLGCPRQGNTLPTVRGSALRRSQIGKGNRGHHRRWGHQDPPRARQAPVKKRSAPFREPKTAPPGQPPAGEELTESEGPNPKQGPTRGKQQGGTTEGGTDQNLNEPGKTPHRTQERHPRRRSARSGVAPGRGIGRDHRRWARPRETMSV